VEKENQVEDAGKMTEYSFVITLWDSLHAKKSGMSESLGDADMKCEGSPGVVPFRRAGPHTDS
jgi:hypothetical protein